MIDGSEKLKRRLAFELQIRVFLKSAVNPLDKNNLKQLIFE